MRVVAIEEHVAPKDLDDTRGQRAPRQQELAILLDDVGDGRLEDMDRSGISTEMLSSTPPDPAPGRLGAMVAGRHDRFGGFASLSTPEPAGCPGELEQAGRSTIGCDGSITMIRA